MGNTAVRTNGKALEQFEAANQATQLRSAQGRLKRYQELLEKIRSL